MTLSGRRIVVTGGARGIGAACVRAFALQGASVVSLDVLDDENQRTAAAADAAGPGRAFARRCDVADRDQVQSAMAAAAEHLGGLDVLAHIAGIEFAGPAESMPPDQIDAILEVNVKGTIHTNQAAFAAMRDTGGAIVNVGSDAGLAGYPTLAVYAASKGAVMAWTRTAALEWARHGVTVNSLVPAIWTPMYEAHRARMTPEALAEHDAAMARNLPLGGRLGDPERDLAPVMTFLASPGARFITGQVIAVNGGVGMVR